MRKVLKDNEGIDSDSANQGVVQTEEDDTPKEEETNGILINIFLKDRILKFFETFRIGENARFLRFSLLID